jgi:hypothetical protein
MTKYEIILYWSNADDAFIALVPELTGCAADGISRQEALGERRNGHRRMDSNGNGTRTSNPRS